MPKTRFSAMGLSYSSLPDADALFDSRFARHRNGHIGGRRRVADALLMTHHETFTFEAAGLTLEARWDLPETARQVVVLCHPHPMQRGTMNAPLMVSLAESLAHDGFAVLRFNFRGAGDSEGEHDYGDGEMDDVASAVSMRCDRFPDLPLGVAGWSFGAVTSLRWQARDQNGLEWVGVATPVGSTRSKEMPQPATLARARSDDDHRRQGPVRFS